MLTLDQIKPHPLQKGFHKSLSHPYIFVDSCVQIWGDTDYSKLNSYGCTAFCITTFRPDDDSGNAMDSISNWYRISKKYDEVCIAYTAQDIIDAKTNNQAAIVFVSQGGDFVGRNINRLEVFHKLGLRMMIPAYNKRNSICDGCLEPANNGLSEFGKQWVEECQKLGILIDLSHVGEKSSLEILSIAKKPVVFSHSNPKSLVNIPRAITDIQIKKCAATGGIIGVTNWGPLNLKKSMTSRPTIENYMESIKYIIDLVGIDHVGIGTDMSLGTYPDGDLIRGLKTTNDYSNHIESNPRSKLRYVEGFDDYGDLMNVVDSLEKIGLSEYEIKKILGDNWLRVFKDVWKN